MTAGAQRTLPQRHLLFVSARDRLRATTPAPPPTASAGTATPTETPELPARDGTSEPTPTPPVTSPSEPEPKSGDRAVDCDASASGVQRRCSSAAGATPACPPERCASPP